MKSQSLRHDVIRRTAIGIVGIFASLLREEQQHDAYVEVYERLKEGFDLLETKEKELNSRIRGASGKP
ncbi:MAG TPA: hypothetical protein VFE62_10295 [Gemmataceae bacterium]|nr:hypothetical protein [Gemmataceae bacterium]